MQEVEKLARLAHHLGVEISTQQAEALLLHLSLVLERNRSHNLTRITEPDVALVSHIVDSLALLPIMDRHDRDGSVADLGSGAGYPGIPLALMRQRTTILVESSRKKALFLEESCERLGLASWTSVANERAEELAARSPSAFGSATARALAGLGSLVELACPLLRMGGVLLAMKGDPAEEELDAGRTVASLLGMRQIECHRYLLPGGGQDRCIVVYEKFEETDRVLPRRPGMAQRRPLA